MVKFTQVKRSFVIKMSVFNDQHEFSKMSKNESDYDKSNDEMMKK
jgi:hypothetical protein